MPAVRLLIILAAGVMGTVASREPVIWWIVGYPFPSGPVLVCIFAVIITRLVMGLQAHTKGQFLLDFAVMILCLLVTVVWVQAHQLDLLAAGISGIGVAGTGVGIIGLAKTATAGMWKEAVLTAFDVLRGNGPMP